MELASEKNERIKIWMEELKNHIYIKLGDISFKGFVTKERLPYEEALKRDLLPKPARTPWGAKWEYGWFFGEVVLPDKAQGKRIFLRPDVGGEMLLYVNGRAAGSRDLQHDGITLTRSGKAGERFFIGAESYAGHGPRLENGGPSPAGRIAVPEPPACQTEVGTPDFGIWNEDAFQLLMDVFTLYRLNQGLDPKSLRAMKVREGLFRFTLIADFELEPEKMNESFRKAREVLKPLLSCVNGSTAPEFTIFGQSHLDLAWKWTWEETRRKCARTISAQLALSDEYEEYRFLLCEPPIMENLKENYPELYGRVVKKVEEGKFIPEGGMYVESDTNLVWGESLIRQCIYGRKWFRREFGTESVMAWLPDCFGFNGQLPQILKGCGIRYFSTQKLSRARKGCDVFPYNTFWWEGIDGSRILTNFHKENNAKLDPYETIVRWNEDRVQQENIDTFLFPFGFGDGGGGATRKMLEAAGRMKDLEGAPRTRMESPVQFFERTEKKGTAEEVYRGELYLPWHRGTYTSQAEIKKENRRAETALREAELWTSLRCFLENGENEQEILEALWKTLLFQHFHDILAGTSITRVCEETVRDLKKVKEEGNRISGEARKRLAVKGLEGPGKRGLLVFNSLSWEREEAAEIPAEAAEPFIENGTLPVTQRIGDSVFIPVRIPSCGYADVTAPFNSCGSFPGCSIYMEKENFILENSYIKAVVDGLGRITSLAEKETGTEYVSSPCNQFLLYQDITVEYDAWEISSFYQRLPETLEKKASLRIAESGPLAVILEVTRTLGHSPMTQQIILRYNSPRLDFATKIDWKETHRLLKTAFPVNVHTTEALEEIQFGYIKRPTHKNRQSDGDQFEVCNYRYTALAEPGRTAALLNDCKYGVSTNDNSMELTLLKSPVWPDMYADKGLHEFTYSFYVRSRDFADSGVMQEGMQLNIPLSFAGEGTGKREYFGLSSGNVILEAVKMAEDGSGDMILRLYEAAGKHTSCTLSSGLPVSESRETDMEENLKDSRSCSLKKEKGHAEISLAFKPFEIKTLRLKP